MDQSTKDAHYQRINDCCYLKELSDIEVPAQCSDFYLFCTLVCSFFVGVTAGVAFAALGSLLLMGFFLISGYLGSVGPHMGIVFQLGFFTGVFGTIAFGVVEYTKANKRIDDKIQSCKNKLSDDYSIAFNDRNKLIKNANEARKKLKNELETDEQFLSDMLEDIENESFTLSSNVKSWIFQSVRILNDEREQAKKQAQKEKENAKKFRSQLKGESIEKPKEKVKIEESE